MYKMLLALITKESSIVKKIEKISGGLQNQTTYHHTEYKCGINMGQKKT